MEVIVNVVIALGSVLMGWVLAEPYRLPGWIALWRQGNWKGEWHCSWVRMGRQAEWIDDVVEFRQRLGKLRVQVREQGGDYQWEAKGMVRRGRVLGEYWSTRPQAQSFGTLDLEILPQGDSMIGFSIGPDNHGVLTTWKILFAKTLEQREALKENFREAVARA